jgi:hypothetical protein
LQSRRSLWILLLFKSKTGEFNGEALLQGALSLTGIQQLLRLLPSV